jgi:hypothetical protein
MQNSNLDEILTQTCRRLATWILALFFASVSIDGRSFGMCVEGRSAMMLQALQKNVNIQNIYARQQQQMKFSMMGAQVTYKYSCKSVLLEKWLDRRLKLEVCMVAMLTDV